MLSVALYLDDHRVSAVAREADYPGYRRIIVDRLRGSLLAFPECQSIAEQDAVRMAWYAIHDDGGSMIVSGPVIPAITVWDRCRPYMTKFGEDVYQSVHE